jgi:hypothetical protein
LWLLLYKESLRESVHSVVLCNWRRSIGMKWQVCCCCCAVDRLVVVVEEEEEELWSSRIW